MRISMRFIKRTMILICCIGISIIVAVYGIASNTPIVKTEETTEDVLYSTKTFYDDNMREGLSELRQEGKKGKKTVIYTVSYRNDKEISRKKRIRNHY